MAFGEALFAWLNQHKEEIQIEAKHREMGFEEFIIFMLDDALDAYKNGRGT